MLSRILNHYPPDIQHHTIESLGNAGGFSGASLWKLESASGTLCLRRWPKEHPTVERLKFIHSVQQLAHRSGLSFVPQPLPTQLGTSFCQDEEGRLWEITDWMPGAPALAPADRCGQSSTLELQELLRKAMQSLAEFHVAVEDHPHARDLTNKSAGLTSRLEFCQRLLEGGLTAASDSLQHSQTIYRSELESIYQLAAPRVSDLHNQLQGVSHQRFRIQPCLRDVWHDHILFQNDCVSGIIDFGAIALETVAIDVARLLTSVEAHLPDAWQVGVDSYSATRSLSVAEQQVLPLFREATVVLSGFNWIRWLAEDGRRFENERGVERRLKAINLSLQRLM